MLKFMIAFVISMWMATFISFALDCPQRILIDSLEYPAKIVYKGDTLVIAYPWQLKYINDHFIVGLDECTITSDSLYRVIKNFLTLYTDQQRTIHSQDSALVICDSLHQSDVRIHVIDSTEIRAQRRELWWKNFTNYLGWTVAVAEIVIFAVIPKLKE